MGVPANIDNSTDNHSMALTQDASESTSSSNVDDSTRNATNCGPDNTKRLVRN